ncbi:MAG: SNF2 family helicase [Firmicutes bacterium]|nr:SNF2 family helicase [Bacillota bacterium]
MSSYFISNEICLNYLNELRAKGIRSDRMIRNANEQLSENLVTIEHVHYNDVKIVLQKKNSVRMADFVGRFFSTYSTQDATKLAKEFEQDEKPVVVDITLTNGQFLVNSTCDCSENNEPCVHRVMAILKLDHFLREKPFVPWQYTLNTALKTLQKTEQKTQAPGKIFVFSLENDKSNTMSAFVYSVSLKDFADKLPESGFLQANALKDYINDENPRKLYTFPGDISDYVSPPEVIAAARIIISDNKEYNRANDLKNISLFCEKAPVFLGEDEDPFITPLEILKQEPPVEFFAQRTDAGIKISLSVNVRNRVIPLNSDALKVVQKKPLWILCDNVLFPVTGSLNLFQSFLNTPEVFVPVGEEDELLENYFMPIIEKIAFRGDLGDAVDFSAEPVKRVYLSEEDSQLRAELRFGYGDFELNHNTKYPSVSASTGKSEKGKFLVRVRRDPDFETNAFKDLTGFGLKKDRAAGCFVLKQNMSAAEFLYNGIPELATAGYEVFGEEKLTSVKVNRSRPSISLNVSSGIDWFDVKTVINFGELSVSLKEVSKAIRKKQKFVKLSDGSVGLLPTDWVEKYKHLFSLGKESDDGTLRMSKYQITLLEGIVNDVDKSVTDKEFKDRCKKLRDFSSIESFKLPDKFTGELRQYQKAGFDWLHFLHKYDFGGCLADDMGTGKTIQTIAFITSLRESEHPKTPDLVVMPRSLIFNWEREIEKFSPNMKVLTYTDKERNQSVESIMKYDVVFTTYGLMMRDIDFLKQIKFHYVILDESQAIKNPLSQRARAARHLNCEHRLVLTGTPVENNTLELWSQFSFINPGLLGNLDYFKNEFANPIEKSRDESTSSVLRKIVFPFILRRTKTQVAKELPPRTERILYCDMEPEQRKLYEEKRDHYRAMLLGIIEDKGMNDARMKILEGLLRLRQISNHPALVDEKYDGKSSKFEELFDMLDTLKSEGHKALIFSQFTKMLGLIRKELEVRKIPYVYLDGQTKNRSEQVDLFQNDPNIPIFLLSLKAGGLGLNLTAAEYVIHIDPWWNPAVEVQASDRAHRIGQDKPVFIYKMITRGTVEEKILDLQEKKKDLVDQIIQEDAGLFKSLTGDDVKVLFS